MFEDVFRYQYRISRDMPPIHSSWQKKRLDSWTIEHCPALQSSEIVDGSGKLVAMVLGIAVSPEGRCIEAQEALSDTDAQNIEAWIEQLSGRFVVLALVDGTTRLYCDPSGNLSVVYNAEEQVVASSVTLAIEGDIHPPADIEIEAIAARQQRLLFGETVDRRVTRATPNHYLNLAEFQETRHWPREDTEFASLDETRNNTCDEIAERITRNVSALVTRYSCALPITAGRDSRIILAAAHPVLDKVRHFYCYGLNWATEIDAQLGAQLAAHLAVPFQSFLRKSPRVQAAVKKGFVAEEHDRMRLRTGWCYAMRRDWIDFIEMSPRVDVVLRGTTAEMTRANKWNGADIGQPCTAKVGLNKLIKAIRPSDQPTELIERREHQLLTCYETWMTGLPVAARDRLYDLAHIEIWIPSVPVLEFSASVDDFIVNPFNDRRLMHLTSTVAPRARRRSALVDGLIRRLCPSLLDFPFHRQFVQSINNANRPD